MQKLDLQSNEATGFRHNTFCQKMINDHHLVPVVQGNMIGIENGLISCSSRMLLTNQLHSARHASDCVSGCMTQPSNKQNLRRNANQNIERNCSFLNNHSCHPKAIKKQQKKIREFSNDYYP